MTEDTRNLISGTITWYEDEASGRGYLRLEFDDGGFESEEIQCDDPIDASTDSHDIANMFQGYDWQYVEHDREYVHVTALI